MELYRKEDLIQKEDILRKENRKKILAAKNRIVETRTPPDLKPLKTRSLDLEIILVELKIEYLRILFKFLFGKNAVVKKAEIAKIIAEKLSFSSVVEFEEWFFWLPELTQRILNQIAFTDFVPIQQLEKQFNVSLMRKKTEYSWRIEWEFIPELQLDFLPVHNNYGCPVTILPFFFQSVLLLWLAPPPGSPILLENCRIQDQTINPTQSWDNSLLIADTFPLLCEALQGMLGERAGDEIEKSIRGGFKKSDLNELRSSTGFLPFNSSGFPGGKDLGEFMPDSVDLAARFILCMYNRKPKRPKDGQEEIRNMVQAFFSEKSQYMKTWYSPDRSFLEYNICIDHLARSPGNYTDDDKELPASRKVFYNILLYIARDGNWFDADRLSDHVRFSRKNFSFSGYYLEESLKIRADTININGATFTQSYSDFRLNAIIRSYFLINPLFKAYCYFLAVFGLLEIVQAAAPLARDYRKKQYPISPYDSIKAIRITELGRWCLGLSENRPPRPSQEYQAIADQELLLVTVQGSSLERKVFLDKIGQRLGEDRWRISPATLVAGSASMKQINERIERFKLLIDKNPAPHWEQLFRKAVDRAELFKIPRNDMLVYDLPKNREILEELLQDPELKRIARRVEGNMLVVSIKDQKKFFALLQEHGIAHFS